MVCLYNVSSRFLKGTELEVSRHWTCKAEEVLTHKGIKNRIRLERSGINFASYHRLVCCVICRQHALRDPFCEGPVKRNKTRSAKVSSVHLERKIYCRSAY